MSLPIMTGPDEAQTIHVVDDDPSIRVALDGLFRSVGYTVRTFASASEFMASGSAQAAGCVILDVRLPGISGLDFQVQLAEAGVQMPVILMTGHGDIPMSVRGMKAGAVDFLPKPFREQDMLDAVTTALARDARQRAEQQGSQELRERYVQLSPREREVMGFVAQGRMNKQIAWDLELSEITVKIHRGNAMRKMGARNLADFVKMAEAVKDIL
ncbi:LuxR family two component transcriptional regulator [Novosphingobium sp. PhB165]|uniref:response regulator transcription factor n=1 Tax=Novosphingobium sp. PhB165 TaxID=2485105 RepID=UPI0010EF88FA|nr:response regulator transcription factor [Novosphingobium sp. PhB165]TCM16551.1 LuxR family two component transcriptional regulator [Novosphingobium sp. PhB165]